MRFNNFNNKKKEGFTLIELTVYVALLGVISVFMANSLIQILSTYQQARAEREVISNSRLLMETITKNISSAQEVYAPTSRFNTDLGQLSLITAIDPTAEHTTAYIDFWTDGGQLLMRAEGHATTTLSSASVQINKFRLEHLFQGLGREAVKITLGVIYGTAPYAASTTLNSTTALRGNY